VNAVRGQESDVVHHRVRDREVDRDLNTGTHEILEGVLASQARDQVEVWIRFHGATGLGTHTSGGPEYADLDHLRPHYAA
jgi:hypothetical protein